MNLTENDKRTVDRLEQMMISNRQYRNKVLMLFSQFFYREISLKTLFNSLHLSFETQYENDYEWLIQIEKRWFGNKFEKSVYRLFFGYPNRDAAYFAHFTVSAKEKVLDSRRKHNPKNWITYRLRYLINPREILTKNFKVSNLWKRYRKLRFRVLPNQFKRKGAF